MANKVKLVNFAGEIINEVEFNNDLLVSEISKQAMFDAVVAENNARRQGTHSTLTKAEVRGGGRKPFMQKHTGNARQGSIRNPQWVGGGVAFGPKPNRNYKNKVNTKVAKLAFKSAITDKLQKNSIMLLSNDLNVAKPSTKLTLTMLKKLDLSNIKVLFVLNENQVNATKSIRNIEKATVKSFKQVSTKDVMNTKMLIIQETACSELGKVKK